MLNYFSMTWMPSKTGKEPGWCHSIQRSVLLWVSALVGTHIEYTIHETVLTRSKTYKYLGLHLSDDFKWTTHISRITKKAYQQLCFVRRNTRNLPKSFGETAYQSLIRPHVEYCSSVWDPHTLSDTQKIERIQRQAARYVTGDYRRSSSVSEMLHNLKWTNLSTRRSVNRLTMIYNILNGHSAITPNNFFEFNRREKLHNFTLRTYQPRGNIDKFAFVQRSIPEWNTLPNVIVQANSTEQFRVLLEKHRLQQTRCLHWHSSKPHTQVHLRDRLQSPLRIIRRRRRTVGQRLWCGDVID